MKNTLTAEFKILVSECSEAQLDAAFAVLKYREIGILRKAKSLAAIFQTDSDTITDGLPKVDGRVLDEVSRAMICDLLIAKSRSESKLALAKTI
jgi:hypothetical protein